MKRSLTMNATSTGCSLRVLVTSAMLFAVFIVTIVVISPSEALAAKSVRHGDAKDLFYTTSGAGTGLPNGAEIFAIAVSGAKVTTRDIGPTHGGDCGSLALSPHGTLYSMCGPLLSPAAGDHQPEDWTRTPVWRACPRTRRHGHGLRPQRDSLRSWRL